MVLSSDWLRGRFPGDERVPSLMSALRIKKGKTPLDLREEDEGVPSTKQPRRKKCHAATRDGSPVSVLFFRSLELVQNYGVPYYERSISKASTAWCFQVKHAHHPTIYLARISDARRTGHSGPCRD